jgi:N-acetylglucosaminyl-diphospho-decaprenol L-rhamnosyltransferase
MSSDKNNFIKLRACISIVSHNQINIINNLLSDIVKQNCIEEMHIILTLNVKDEVFDPKAYPSLSISVIRNDIPKGFSFNHNQAFKYNSSNVFCILNPDIRLSHPSSLIHLIEEIEGGNSIVVPRIVNNNGDREDSIRMNLTPWSAVQRVVFNRRAPGIISKNRKGTQFYWVAGMFLMCKSKVYAELGGFNERFFMYCEDYDLSARAYLSGFTIKVVEDVTVIHDARRSSHRSITHLRWHLSSLIHVWTSKVFWRIIFK